MKSIPDQRPWAPSHITASGPGHVTGLDKDAECRPCLGPSSCPCQCHPLPVGREHDPALSEDQGWCPRGHQCDLVIVAEWKAEGHLARLCNTCGYVGQPLYDDTCSECGSREKHEISTTTLGGPEQSITVCGDCGSDRP